MRILFKREEKEFLFRKYKNDGYNTWEASDKIKFIQDYLINYAKDLKNKLKRKLNKIERELNNKKSKSLNIIKVKSELELDMESKFSRKFEEMLQQV